MLWLDCSDGEFQRKSSRNNRSLGAKALTPTGENEAQRGINPHADCRKGALSSAAQTNSIGGVMTNLGNDPSLDQPGQRHWLASGGGLRPRDRAACRRRWRCWCSPPRGHQFWAARRGGKGKRCPPPLRSSGPLPPRLHSGPSSLLPGEGEQRSAKRCDREVACGLLAACRRRREGRRSR